jgi:hypothetical protein
MSKTTKTTTTTDRPRLAVKAKAILIALHGETKPLAREAIAAKSPIRVDASWASVRLTETDTTSYCGSITRHAHWDNVANDPDDKRWGWVSLLGLGLVTPSKVAGKKGQPVDAFKLTDKGASLATELVAEAKS